MSVKKIFTFLMIFSIFSGAFVYGQGAFEFYGFYLIFLCFLLLYLMHQFSIHINKVFLVILLILMLISFVNAISYGLSLGLVIKQTVGILLSALAYYLLIKVNNYDIEKLFKLYLGFAFVVCIIGLFQELFYIINFSPGYNFGWFLSTKWILTKGTSSFPLLRVNSIMTEPSVFAIVLTPAMFVALSNLLSRKTFFFNKTKSLIIIIAFLLSFSTIGYFGLLPSFIMVLYNRNSHKKLGKKKLVYLLLTISLLFNFVIASFAFIPDVRIRANDTLRVIKGENINLGNVKYSVFSLYSNLLVTKESLNRNLLFGSALGNHIENHKKFISKIFPQYIDNPWIKVNQEDANSLLLRLLSETGIFGVIIVLYFLYSFFIRTKDHQLLSADPKSAKYALINNGIFVLLLLHLARQGHYFLDGLFFFVFLYYFTGKNYKEKTKQLSMEKNK